jgi:preprotein translocase subunit SecE
MAGIQHNESRAHSIWSELLSAALYKPSQGRVTRQLTFAALALTIGIGVWRLAQLLPLWFGPGSGLMAADSPGAFGFSPADDLGVIRFLVPGILLAAGLWFCFRLVNMPLFADFLIAVESEMAKVSWPTTSEVVRSSTVVIALIFALAAILAAYDLFWWFVLRYVLKIT